MVTTNLMGCGSLIIHNAFQNLHTSFSIPKDEYLNYSMPFDLTLSFRFQKHMDPLNGTSKQWKNKLCTRVLFQIGKEGILITIAKFPFMHLIYLNLPVGLHMYSEGVYTHLPGTV